MRQGLWNGQLELSGFILEFRTRSKTPTLLANMTILHKLTDTQNVITRQNASKRILNSIIKMVVYDNLRGLDDGSVLRKRYKNATTIVREVREPSNISKSRGRTNER